jgi:hypothetical protein
MHGSPPTPIAINHDVRRFGFTKIEQEPFSAADHTGLERHGFIPLGEVGSPSVSSRLTAA